MVDRRTRARLVTALLAALVTCSCADPPNKEMDQAQGAIDAARAAGADRYASEEYTAAVTALAQAHDAVAQGDYRLALSYALESREHAQNAARDAAEARARIRGEVERSMAEIAALMAQANTMVEAAERARAPRRAVRDARQELSEIDAHVQEAGAAMQADDYPAAQPALQGVKERIGEVIAAIEGATKAQSQRRR